MDKQFEASQIAITELGFPGRLLSASKSKYHDMYPDHVIIFNANICVDPGYKIWYGDLDLDFDWEKLAELSRKLDRSIYILREMDARFENEKNPRLDRAVLILNPDLTSEIRY